MVLKPGPTLKTTQRTHQRISGNMLLKCFFGIRDPDKKTKHRYLRNLFRKTISIQIFKTEVNLQNEDII